MSYIDIAMWTAIITGGAVIGLLFNSLIRAVLAAACFSSLVWLLARAAA